MMAAVFNRIWRHIAPRPTRSHGAIILMYHRICDDVSDPWGLSVSPRHFEQQMQVLVRDARAISLMDLSREATGGSLRRPTVAVTFDDGYADNKEIAVPILESLGIPATLFIPTIAIDGKREFWWDELEQIFLAPGELPTELDFTIDGELERFSFSEASSWGEQDVLRWSSWRYWDPPPSPRHAAYLQLWYRMYDASGDRKRTILDELHRWAGTQPRIRRERRTMTTEDIRAMAGHSLVSIGGHSVTHPALGRNSRDVQREEIRANKAFLEDLTGGRARSFSYPHGDYDAATVELVNECGFSIACKASGGAVSGGDNPLLLPRQQVGDQNGETFRKHLLQLVAGHA